MKPLIYSLLIISFISCSKSDKTEVFKCKINGTEYSSTNATVTRDSVNIKINVQLNNGHYFNFEVINFGVKSYNLGFNDSQVQVLENSKIHSLSKPSSGNGDLNIEKFEGWDFNRRMSGTFYFTINSYLNTSYIVTNGVFKNIPVFDY